MQCGICEQHHRRITCPQCSQAAVWPLRTEILFKTAERDVASEKVEEYLDGARGAAEVRTIRAEDLRGRLASIATEKASLKGLLVNKQAHMEKLRTQNDERRRRLEAVRELARNQDGVLEAVQRDTKRIYQKWKILYGRTAEARSFLCREAASLHGLRLKRRRSGRVEYMIGGVAIPNLLTDLNSYSHTNINVSLDLLAHLLVLVAHYLGLRLPNEITLPARDAPVTTVKGLLNNRHVVVRPLYIDVPLSVLAQENPTAHSKFVEGVSMLALDVAWLCFSQGLEISEFEDACSIGYCMWKLLVAKDSTASMNHAFGRTSHATINGNLATAPGEAMMSKFKLRYNLIVDRIRYTLQGETIVADWDLVPDAERAVPTPRRRSEAALLDGTKEAADGDVSSPTRQLSTSGGGVGRWTRIRARNGAG